jgi:hypothetical protein
MYYGREWGREPFTSVIRKAISCQRTTEMRYRLPDAGWHWDMREREHQQDSRISLRKCFHFCSSRLLLRQLAFNLIGKAIYTSARAVGTVGSVVLQRLRWAHVHHHVMSHLIRSKCPYIGHAWMGRTCFCTLYIVHIWQDGCCCSDIPALFIAVS